MEPERRENMNGRLVFAAFAALAIGAAHAATDDDFVKQSIDATRPVQIDLAPDGTVVPSDLTLDPGFGNSGLKSIWPPAPAGWSDTEDGLRVFPWIGSVTLPGPPPVTLPNMHKGYYLVGKQKNAAGDGWRGWIARVNVGGTLDTSFGTNGWIYTITMDDIVDAVIVGNNAYILSNIRTTAQAIPAAKVQCKDLTDPGSDPNGGYCLPSGAGILTFGAAPAGPRTAAYGQRLAYDSRYGLFVAARVMNNNRGQEVGIALISADDGSLVAEFRDAGYSIGQPTWAHPTQAEVSVNALVVTPAGYPGGTRLYVAGQMKRDADDHDGFILGLGPTNGATAANWNWNDRSYYYESDNTGYKKDAITALTVLRNGKIAFAGWSETDAADVRPMMMGRLDANGSKDAGFCAGNANSGLNACLVDPPFSTGSPFFVSYKPFSWPVALVERRQSRDLVVAQRFQNNGGSILFPDDKHVRTLVQQFGASGNRIHANLTVDHPGATNVLWSRPFDLWMGGTGLQTADGGLGEEVIAVVGTRQWSGNDFDATMSHLMATDSLFADAFGGQHSD
jgi:hypothetical protein